MIISTGTRVDSLLTVDDAPIGGVISSQLLVLVQSDAEVGATTFCIRAAKANMNDAGYIGVGSYIRDAGCAATVDLTGFGIDAIQAAALTLLKGGLRLIIIDAVQWATGELHASLYATVPVLKQRLIEHDACAIVVTGKYKDPTNKRVYITGNRAFTKNADYIVQLDLCDAGFTASCIYAPGGCSFLLEPWLKDTA
jgi:hypothetical protein